MLHYKDHIHESFVIFAHLRRCVLNPGGKKEGFREKKWGFGNRLGSTLQLSHLLGVPPWHANAFELFPHLSHKLK